jgi:hypothetical protein
MALAPRIKPSGVPGTGKGAFVKTIGLIGGMSWESTIPYYRIINETIKERLGGLHSARIVLYSVDFQEIERLQQAGNWEAAGTMSGRCGAFTRGGRSRLPGFVHQYHAQGGVQH